MRASFFRPRAPLVAAALLAGAALLLGANCQTRHPAALVASGLSNPVTLGAPAGDPRLFVVQLNGLVRVVKNGTVLTTPFLDLRGRVGTAGEEGVLGIAFPDDFAESGEFYLYYIDLAHDSVLARFAVDPANPDRALLASEQVVLRVDQPPDRFNHKGGTIAFSPVDGMLYWGLGDGGSSNDPDNLAQNPDVLLGKMLRLDVGGDTATYTIPPDNPFVGPDGVRDEIWALGFRNPYRWSFDRETGDLWIGDVGQARREEVDFEPAGDPGGRNYGWKVHEGTLCNLPQPGLPCEDPAAPDRFTFPVYEYPTRVDGTCAITGGVVVRGSAAWLRGSYLFADYCSDRVFARAPSGAVTDVTASLAPTQGTLAGIVAIAEDGFGEAYLVSIESGQIHRIQ